MSPDMTFLGSIFCGVAIAVFLFTIYAHVEGNRVSAIRHTFLDIRRDMLDHPAHEVWLRAFRIAMGWRRTERNHRRRGHDVTAMVAPRYSKGL